MSATIALNGDVTTVPAPNFTPGPVTYTDGTKITVDGTWVITQAQCTFTETIIPFRVDNVTLNGSSSKLLDNSTAMIRNGDSATGSFGNQLLAVVSQTKLKSA